MKCSRTVAMYVWWWWSVSWWFLSCCNAQPSDILNVLQQQVRDLIDHRARTDKILDDLKIATDVQVATLKEEIETLRREISNIRGGGSVNQQRNDHITLQWLQGAVREIRTELQTELSATHNATEQHTQEFTSLVSDVVALRSDVASSRADIETLRGDQTRTSAQTQQCLQDANTAVERSQSCAASCANLRAQVESAQADWSHNNKRRPESFDDNDTRYIPRSSSSSNDVERRLRRVEKRLKSALWSHAQASRRAADHAELLTRVASLENVSRSEARALFNVTQEVAGVTRVQQTTAQLMESMSALESRLDSGLPELQREVSRLEFELAQATSSLQVAKDAQDQQNNLLKSFAESISKLEKSSTADRALLAALQYEIAAADGPAQQHPQTTEGVQDVQVSRLVRDLGRLEGQYYHLVHTLPHDCESVTGPSGEYMIAPRLAPEERDNSAASEAPTLAWCDQQTGAGGWTVVQRRSNGGEKFNRRWAEYEAGFGAPAGEFWLGNAALRRLTADNCSSLRVDLRDIYGQSWFAEYSEFSVGSAQDGYRLWVSGYQGNASDAFDYQNLMQFSAVDSDRDISNTHCAANYEGGWWFSHCQHVNLNGRYNLGLTWFDASRNEWIAVAWSEMKVRRRAACGGDK